MSRLVSKQYVDALLEPSERPPIDLGFKEVDLEESNEKTANAVLALTAAVGALCSKVVAATKQDQLLAALEKIAECQKIIIAQTKPSKPVPWRFKVHHNEYGDMDYVDAIPGEKL